MEAEPLVFAALALAAGILLLAFRERLGARARRRGAPLGARLYALAGVLLLFYGALTLAVEVFAR